MKRKAVFQEYQQTHIKKDKEKDCNKKKKVKKNAFRQLLVKLPKEKELKNKKVKGIS